MKLTRAPVGSGYPTKYICQQGPILRLIRCSWQSLGSDLSASSHTSNPTSPRSGVLLSNIGCQIADVADVTDFGPLGIFLLQRIARYMAILTTRRFETQNEGRYERRGNSNDGFQRNKSNRHRLEGHYQDRFGQYDYNYRVHSYREKEYTLIGRGSDDGKVVTESELREYYIRSL